MALTAFPEPADLPVDFVNRTGDSKNINLSPWSVENPHPHFGKDPNILNELGHTKFPMWVESKIDHKRVIVNNEMELAQHTDAANDWKSAPQALREDGPTIQQYVDAGLKASTYPPFGYASKSSDEEIKAAVAKENETPNPWANLNASK